MQLNDQIALHLRHFYFGGNWTDVNLKDTVADLNWEQATTPLPDLHTIAELVYHINYYVHAVLQVLEGKPLTASDKFSFQAPAIASENNWQQLLEQCWKDAEAFASCIEKLPVEQLGANFQGEAYGNYYRNLQGIIEHGHYHLGQIVLIKKMMKQQCLIP